MANLYVHEEFVNVDKNDRYSHTSLGESEVYETGMETAGELYRAYNSEFGRCISKVYQHTDDGISAIGWVFLKRANYDDDGGETYLQETWVTVHTAPPTVTTEYHYLEV